MKILPLYTPEPHFQAGNGETGIRVITVTSNLERLDWSCPAREGKQEQEKTDDKYLGS